MRAPKVSLNDKVFKPLQVDGWVVKKDNTIPNIFYLATPDGSSKSPFKFIFRNVTEQGRDQHDKRRMQVKRFTLHTSGKTILLGWSDEFQVFVAWDARLHDNHGVSSMVSCYVEVLKKAIDEGYSAGYRWNKMLNKTENYISFTPDFLGDFLQICYEVFEHVNGKVIEDIEEEAAEGIEVSYEAEEEVELETTTEGDFVRATVERTVKEKVRDHRFRKKMLKVYQGKCAVCRTTGDDILQGAHIIPVANGGTDNENNGLLLCANHHLLYDRGILKIKKDLSIALFGTYNKQQWYKDLLEDFEGKIHSPSDNLPSRENLEKRFLM